MSGAPRPNLGAEHMYELPISYRADQSWAAMREFG